MVNVSLDNAKMTKYKQKLAEEKEARRVEAARVIQERARVRQAKLRALGVIGTIKSYTQEEQAVVIQKEWKKHLMRGWHQGRKEEAAALIVQSRWRRMQTMHRFRDISRTILKNRREEGAALRVQCAYRRRASQLHVGGLARAMIRTHHAAVRFNHDREDFTQHLQWQDDHRAGKWDKKIAKTDAEKTAAAKDQWTAESAGGGGREAACSTLDGAHPLAVVASEPSKRGDGPANFDGVGGVGRDVGSGLRAPPPRRSPLPRTPRRGSVTVLGPRRGGRASPW